jgi:hypothetical protein
MRLIWLGLAVLLVVAAVGGSTRTDNPSARIGLYCLAAAAGLWFLTLLI